MYVEGTNTPYSMRVLMLCAHYTVIVDSSVPGRVAPSSQAVHVTESSDAVLVC